jgi:GH15 family glucan-1,4-alpha-glucosidase
VSPECRATTASHYGIIGDTLSTALVSKDGSIDWLCWPRHDSGALFLRLLDDEIGGFSDVLIEDGGPIGRRYLDGTNILETTFRTQSAEAALTDFMPVRARDPVPEEGPDVEADEMVIRLLTCTAEVVRGRFRTEPTFDYARQPSMWNEEGDRCACGLGSKLRQMARLFSAATGAKPNLNLHAGERVFYAISHRDAAETRTEIDARAVDGLLQETRRYWDNWAGRCTYRGPYRAQILRSVLVLKFLTHSPTGAIIAAPTMGLPEAVPGDRNYDYRYAWLRDASFIVTSFVNLGYVREAGEHLRFLRTVDRREGSALRLMYVIEGGVPEETELAHLKGWRETGPVRIGNAARDQKQFDIYGEYLIALHFWVAAQDGRAIPESYDLRNLGSSGVTTHVNKVHHVTTITRVAQDLGEDEDWLWDVANEMEIEDGVIWVYGVGEDGVLAFTDFGIENLIELIKMYKDDPTLLKRWDRSE